VVALLVARKANAALRNLSGQTAADIARARGYEDVLRVLEAR